MKRSITVALVAMTLLAADLDAARRKRVVVRGSRGKVVVHKSFPIRRPLPAVVVRPAPVVRVAPRVFLPPVVFGAAVAASLPAANARVWSGSEELDGADGWTEFTMAVDKRGERLLLQIAGGAAQVSFAEVVFDNGDAQVVDFDDRTHGAGVYSLLDFKDGRKVDHVRVVARAVGASTEIRLHLVR